MSDVTPSVHGTSAAAAGSAVTFQQLHEQIDDDPVVELIRRRRMWAGCPDGNEGGALMPEAQIVPLQTIDAAIAELLKHRFMAGVPGTNALYERFYDL